jgi:hypothetical protein
MRSGHGVRSYSWGIAVLFFVACSGPAFTQTSPAAFVELRDFKLEIERAIQEAKRVSPEPPFFIIQKIVLQLKGEKKQNIDGSVNFSLPVFRYGVDLGAHGTANTLQELELELVPAESQIVGGAHLIDLTELTRTLKETFRADSNTKGALAAAAIKYTNSWTLQLGADGKINVVVAKAGVSISEDKTQRVTFHLCQTLNRSDCIK